MRPQSEPTFVIYHRGHMHRFAADGRSPIAGVHDALEVARRLVDEQGGQAVVYKSICSCEASAIAFNQHGDPS